MAATHLSGPLIITDGGIAFVEEGGDTVTFGAIVDGEFLKRVGDEIVSAAGGGGGSFADTVTVTQPTLGDDVLVLTSTAASDDPNYRVVQGRAVTTDNTTQTTIVTIPIAADTSYMMEARLLGRQTGGAGGAVGNTAAQIRAILVKRIGAGAPSIIEQFAGWFDSSTDTTPAFVATVSGNNILVRVTSGDANTNFTWHATVIIQSLST